MSFSFSEPVFIIDVIQEEVNIKLVDDIGTIIIREVLNTTIER